MKKICLDLQPLLSVKTGIGYYAENLIKNLIKREKNNYKGEIYTLLEKNKKIELEGIKWSNHQLLPHFYRRLDFFWKCIPFSINFLIKDNFDIYHSFDLRLPYKIRGKSILTIHDLIPFLFPEFYINMNKKSVYNYIKSNAERADIIVTSSEYSKKEIVKLLNISEEKIKIVPAGIELLRYSKNNSVQEIENITAKYKLPPKFILYLGALEPRKNIPNIILGFSKYKEEKVDSDIKLVIAGKKAWKYEKIFETYELSEYKKDIIFTDYVDEKDKIILYKMAKLFIFPSLYEGFGMPVLEAMASGTPVITSNNSSLPEVVGEAGILVNPDSVEEISEAIAKILDGEEDYVNDLIFKGKERAKNFTWEKSTKLLEDIYEMM